MQQKLTEDHISDEVLKLTFKDPSTGNAFGIEAARELLSLIKEMSSRKSKIRVLIFTGFDRFFCTGGNLKHYRSLKTKSAGIKVNREISKILKTFEAMKIVKIAQVNGDCYGGGLELLSCFDLVFSRNDVLFGFWQSKQGVSFGWGGGARLAKRITLSQAKRLLLGSQTLSAYDAADINLVDRVFSRFEFENATLDFAKRIALNSRKTSSAIQALDLKNESEVFSQLWWSKEHLSRLGK